MPATKPKKTLLLKVVIPSGNGYLLIKTVTHDPKTTGKIGNKASLQKTLNFFNLYLEIAKSINFLTTKVIAAIPKQSIINCQLNKV